MKLTKIEVSCTFNAGNYESVKLGGEWEIESVTEEQFLNSTKIALKEIIGTWKRIKDGNEEKHAEAKIEPQNEEKEVKSSKTLVEFGSPLLQKIVDRIMADKSVTLEIITTHYDLTDDARKVIEAALTLNK